MTAGASAIAAGVILVISGTCLAVFFATEVEFWGRTNDATTALFAALMIAPALEIYSRSSGECRAVLLVATFVGVAGMLIIIVTSGLTAAGRLDWLLSAKIGAVGFTGFIVWMAAVCLVVLQSGGLPEKLAWFGLFTAGVVCATVVLSLAYARTHGSLMGEGQPPAWLSALFAIAFLCFPVWTIWLGIALLE